MRPFTLPLLLLAALALGCAATADTPSPSRGAMGGAGGDPSVGHDGGSAAPGNASGGSGGSSGTGATGSAGIGGGGGGSGGSIGGIVDAAEDAPGGTGGSGDADGGGLAGEAGAGDGGPLNLSDPSTWPGGAFNKPFIKLCPDGAAQATCCLHYCTCMMTNCEKQTPADCLNACMSADNKWDMRCRVYNCFESLNPNAQKDHQAHCEHAGVYTGTQRTRGAGDTHATCHLAGDPDEK